MHAYGFIVDLRQTVLNVGQEKVSFVTAEIIGSTNHSIKEVMMVAEKEVIRHGEEKPFGLDAETEEELVDDRPICVATEDVIGKSTMVIKEHS